MDKDGRKCNYFHIQDANDNRLIKNNHIWSITIKLPGSIKLKTLYRNVI